jgi:hypothetical protein
MLCRVPVLLHPLFSLTCRLLFFSSFFSPQRHFHPFVALHAQHIAVGAPSTGPGALPVVHARTPPHILFNVCDYRREGFTLNPPMKVCVCVYWWFCCSALAPLTTDSAPPKQQHHWRAMQELAGGTVGGALQAIVGHPLDTIKTRLQSGATFACVASPLQTPVSSDFFLSFFSVQKGPLGLLDQDGSKRRCARAV